MPMLAEQFVAHVRSADPALDMLVSDHVRDYGEVLLHVLCGDLSRFSVAAWQRGDSASAGRCLTCAEKGLLQGDDAVRNAIQASLVEDVGSHRQERRLRQLDPAACIRRSPPRPPARRTAHRRDPAAVRRGASAGCHGASRSLPDAHDNRHLLPRHARARPRSGRADGGRPAQPVAPIATKTAPAKPTGDLGIDVSAGQEGWS